MIDVSTTGLPDGDLFEASEANSVPVIPAALPFSVDSPDLTRQKPPVVFAGGFVTSDEPFFAMVVLLSRRAPRSWRCPPCGAAGLVRVHWESCARRGRTRRPSFRSISCERAFVRATRINGLACHTLASMRDRRKFDKVATERAAHATSRSRKLTAENLYRRVCYELRRAQIRAGSEDLPIRLSGGMWTAAVIRQVVRFSREEGGD